MLNFGCVKPQDIDAIWPMIRRYVDDACQSSNGRYEASHIKDFARSGVLQIWVAADGAKAHSVGATELVTYPTGVKALVWKFAVGESREEWLRFMDIVKAWAKAEGCALVEGGFRRGWRRILVGFTHTHDFLETKL